MEFTIAYVYIWMWSFVQNHLDTSVALDVLIEIGEIWNFHVITLIFMSLVPPRNHHWEKYAFVKWWIYSIFQNFAPFL